MENQNVNGIKFVVLHSDEILTKNKMQQMVNSPGFARMVLLAPLYLQVFQVCHQLRTSRSYDSISLEWSEPEYGEQSLTKYTVAYQEVDKKVWKEKHTEITQNNLHVNGLEPDTLYYFKVIAKYTNGTSMSNENSIRIKTSPLPLAHRTKKRSTFIKKKPSVKNERRL